NGELRSIHLDSSGPPTASKANAGSQLHNAINGFGLRRHLAKVARERIDAGTRELMTIERIQCVHSKREGPAFADLEIALGVQVPLAGLISAHSVDACWEHASIKLSRRFGGVAFEISGVERAIERMKSARDLVQIAVEEYVAPIQQRAGLELVG